MENIPPSDGAAGQPASRATKRKASGDLPNDSASRELMPVYLRVRPTEDDDWYIKVVNETEVEVSSGGTVERGRAKYSKSEKFTFSRIFPHTTSQQELYDGVVGPMVDQMFMPGEASSLLLAYGASSSGKTFTTRGTTQNPGVLIRAIDNILGRVGTSSTKLGIKPRRWNEFQTNTGTMPKRISTVSDRDCRYEYAVFLSFAEIYIEQVYDLFQSPVEPSNQDMVFRKGPDAASKRPIAQLKEDTEGRKYINGQIEVRVRDMAEVHNLVESVMQNRSVLSTRMNEASSRSHLFSVVKLLKIPIVDGRSKMEGTEVSRIAVVDLAGAERIVQSGVEGKAHRETKNINKSLHTLAMCVEAMRDNQGKSSVKRGVIPWRESKLTLLLHPYFEFGQARFVVNVHPSMQHSRVTSEVFRFAQRAGALQATAILPRIGPADAEATNGVVNLELLQELENLRQQLSDAERKRVEQEMAIRRDCAREMGKRLQEMEVKHRQRRREAEKAEQEKMDKKLDMANAMHEETVGELTQKIESLEVQLKTATEAAGDAAPLLQKIEELTKTVAQHAAALNAERELVIQLRQQLEEQAAKATMADQTREAGQDLSSPQLQSINDTTDMTINDKDVPASGPSNGDLVQDESSSDSLVKQPKRLSAIPIVSGNESLSKARRPSEPTRASSDRVQIAVESARKKRKSTSRIEPSPSLDSRGTSDSSTVNSPTGTKAARKRRTQSKSRTSLSSNSETSLLDNITEEQKHQSFSIEIVPKAIRRISSRKSLEPKLEASMVQDRTDDDPATSIVPDAENESLADINEGDAPIKKKRKLRTKKAVDMEEFDEPARSSGSGKRYSTIVSRLPRNE